ncbi:MAG: TIGR02217 family protein, partial [Novosphingobium sp.]
MAFWLAEKRTAQQSGFIQRFDPRFWTVDFPRPMMAAATTPAADALRIDAVFLKANDLAGVIWDSVDRWDHPLLAYATDRDYSRTVLSFRWRSAGVLALDAVHGPTLTIEGHDAAGVPRAWYIRLWNYAEGTPTDAQVTLPFSDLAGGFLHPAEADLVHPAAIGRMFVSLVPPGYDPASSAALAAPAEGWAELSAVRCEGHRAMLSIGDVMVPPHGLGIATGYDDAYNQTPARLLRTIRGLGYRGSINHYVGMSHYMRPVRDGAGNFVVDPALPALNPPAEAWHRAFFVEAEARGYSVIASLSYELLAQHCPAAWQQRAADGDPARTGWVPPSALLSPANADAMAWLRMVARAFVALLRDAGLPVRFQLGEPWWWTTADGRICLYDDAAKAAFGGNPPAIPDLRASLNAAQLALLDLAGALLAASTAALAAAVRDEAGGAGAELLLLAYLPTVLDPRTPEARRANLPVGWARPAFDTLQLEAYDWVTDGAEALHAAGVDLATARLSYPPGEQHYIAGFVLVPSAREAWRAIDAAADGARGRGVAETFVWALPQVCRDGYLRLPGPDQEDEVQAFDDVLYPLALGLDAAVVPEFSTAVTVTASG